MGSVLGTAFVATREPSASKYAMLGISSICTGLSSTLYCFKLAESNELKDEREEYLKKKSRTMK